MRLSTAVFLVVFVVMAIAIFSGREHDCPAGSVLVRDAISATKTYCVRTVQP